MKAPEVFEMLLRIQRLKAANKRLGVELAKRGQSMPGRVVAVDLGPMRRKAAVCNARNPGFVS